MIWTVMGIHDQQSKTFFQPFCVRHVGEARRHFHSSVNGGDKTMTEHAADFTLFIIGRFDDETGVLEKCEHTSLGNGVVFKKTEG